MSDVLRVLAICHEDIDWILGGMGQHVRELYRWMCYRGDVVVDLINTGAGNGSQLYTSFHRHLPDAAPMPWKPHSEGMSSVLTQDIRGLRTLLRLVLEGKRWDVVAGHEWGALQLAWAARDLLGIPLVGTMHLSNTHLTLGSPNDDSQDALLRKIEATADLSEEDLLSLRSTFGAAAYPGTELSTYAMNQEARLVCESDETILCSRAYVNLARDLYHLDFLGKSVNMIYNGIDLEAWNPRAGDAQRARSTHHLPEDKPIALFVGRIAEMKGIVHLLSAAEAGLLDDWCVVLAGAVNAVTEADKENWSVTKQIRKLVKAKPGMFRWLDYQYGQSIKDLYAAATVVVMPSTHEPFGLVALEAMAMGVPLVSTEVDGLGEIVVDDFGGEYAMIIPAGSPNAIGEALCILKDPAKRSTLRALGLQRVKDFSWEVAATQTVGVYRKAVERAGQHRQLKG